MEPSTIQSCGLCAIDSGQMIDLEIVDQVLSFWFDGDQNENYKTKWFVAAGSLMQNETDRMITERFGMLLRKAEDGLLDEYKTNRYALLAYIIILDQFSRHVYRTSPKRNEILSKIDPISYELTRILIERNWHVDLSIPHFVFAVMPIRHYPNADRLEELLAIIDMRKEREVAHVQLLQKFRQTTGQRLSHCSNSVLADSIHEHDILERHYISKNDSDIEKHSLYQAMKAYLRQKNAAAHTHMGVSLSGGVDSMVIAHILHKLRVYFNNYAIVAVHIDYANRQESAAEADYVRQWCERFDIVLITKRIDQVRRGITKRDDYEKIARDIRYDTYRSVMQQNNIPGICFGHHRGDVQENVISNMMKGISILDLNGMSESSIVNNVVIWRPLLEFDKDLIFEFAHRYGIPYFKDTTPIWSTRGKLRTQLIPLLREMYGDGLLQNLSNLGAESYQCSELVHQKILEPVLSSIGSSNVAVWVDCSLLRDQPIFIWKETLRQLCHRRMGNSMIREKPIRELMQKVNQRNRKEGWISLKKSNRSYLTKELMLIIFRDRFFLTNELVKGDSIQYIELDKQYQFGPWSLLCQRSSPEDTQSLLKVSHITLWDLVRGNGFEYLIPNAPAFIVNNNNRVSQLRQLDTAITNVIPLVTSKGSFDETKSSCVSVTQNSNWISCKLHYDNDR